jgi:dinuclear metal center YbgI/SA1388 family protein
MELHEFASRFDEELRVDAFSELDASANGLQVAPESGEIEHVAFAVDGVLETAERAAEADADALVVHHGLSWGGIERVTGQSYRRIAPLVENDVALYAAHLPLDAHPTLGNAAGVADVLGVDGREPFGELGPEHVGLRGKIDPASALDIAAELEAELDTGGEDVQVLDFGPDEIESVAVLTGSGADWLDEAADAGVDALVTGEGKGKLYHEAKEVGISVFLAGHYATETFGVRSLMGLTEGWGLETTFLSAPTGL